VALFVFRNYFTKRFDKVRFAFGELSTLVGGRTYFFLYAQQQLDFPLVSLATKPFVCVIFTRSPLLQVPLQ